jgi:hypothetical protein
MIAVLEFINEVEVLVLTGIVLIFGIILIRKNLME